MKRYLTALTLLVTATTGLGADNWPEFRGPGGVGHAPDADLPVTWSETKNVTWKTPVPGKAWSSPVVWGDQVWLTNAYEDGVRLEAWCLNKNTGEVIKKMTLYRNPAPQYCHPFNSYASPSPVIEEGVVYITFGSPYTCAIDTETFEVLWERTDFKCNHFRGAGSSPVIHEDKLLMNFDGSDYQYVVALDKKTGETLWRTDRTVDFKDLGPDGKPDRQGDWRKAFSTPTVRDFGAGPVMISLGSKAIYGYDPDTGKELWRIDWDRAHSGSNRPIVGHGRVYFSTGAGGEMRAIEPDGNKGVEEDWTSRGGTAMKPSLLLVDDLIYKISDGGVLSVHDAETGREVYKSRVQGAERSGAKFSASPLYADGKVYFFDEEGHCTVIEHGRAYKVLGTATLDAGVMATPAITGDAMILRTKTHVYRIEKQKVNE